MVDIQTGEVPKGRYLVLGYKTKLVPSELHPKDIKRFLWGEKTGRARMFVGSWYNAETGQTHLTLGVATHWLKFAQRLVENQPSLTLVDRHG